MPLIFTIIGHGEQIYAACRISIPSNNIKKLLSNLTYQFFYKTFLHLFSIGLLSGLFIQTKSFADTVVFLNNRIQSGTVLQTNDDNVLFLTDNAAFNFSKTNIKEIKVEPLPASQLTDTDRLMDFYNTVLFLSKQAWATNLTSIPATVIDKGILRNVPYSSFHCGEDYEINIYGNLAHPAGIEIGIYRKLIGNKTAMVNCLKFIRNLLRQGADKEVLMCLNLDKDIKCRADLTYEVTPPTDPDAYNGWWISAYSEKELNSVRASDEEMKTISITKTEAAIESSQGNDPFAWSASNLKLARASSPQTFTFTNRDGDVITNAEVVRIYETGISLIWQSGNRVGMVKLADLPSDLQVRFGYDAAKSAAADAVATEKKARQQLENASLANQTGQAAAAVDYSSSRPFYSSAYSSGSSSSGGGRVYVNGYTRKDGTYVSPHYRRK